MRKLIITFISVSILLLSSQAFGWSVKKIKKQMHKKARQCKSKVRDITRKRIQKYCWNVTTKNRNTLKDCSKKMRKACKSYYNKKLKKCKGALRLACQAPIRVALGACLAASLGKKARSEAFNMKACLKKEAKKTRTVRKCKVRFVPQKYRCSRKAKLRVRFKRKKMEWYTLKKNGQKVFRPGGCKTKGCKSGWDGCIISRARRSGMIRCYSDRRRVTPHLFCRYEKEVCTRVK